MTADIEQGTPQAHQRRGLLVRLIRFLAWLCAGFAAFVLAGTAYVYVPCFFGVPAACLTGVLLVAGSVVALLVGLVGLLALFLTRPRPATVPRA